MQDDTKIYNENGEEIIFSQINIEMDYTKDIGDQLLLVRSTGAIPSNGEVITTADARVSSEGGSYDSFPLELGIVNTINPFMSRHTIHFACNSLVNGGSA